jgi:ribosomal protein S18 acetylase RimI-like enzyme
MTETIGMTIRRLQAGDACELGDIRGLEDARALAEFYNGLSEGSRTTFRPLGWTTTVEACARIVQGNLSGGSNADERGTRYDLVAVHRGRIVGWGFIWDLHTAEPIFGLGIADAYQGRGLGAALMDRVMAAARRFGLGRVYLTVVQDNHVAWRLYERRGFVRYGEFVGDDELAYYRMVATL